MRIVVIGAGVIGLSCGVRLAEAGHDVELWGERLPPRTTSDLAAAIWYPARLEPAALVRRWAAVTLGELVRLSAREGSGVRLVTGVKLFHRPMGPPWWRALAPAFRFLAPHELPPGVRCGYEACLPVADMPRYLSGHLVGRLRAAGGRLVDKKVSSLAEAAAVAPLVVHASGLGAAALAGDSGVYAIRGDVVRVTDVAVDRFLLESDGPGGPVYVVPRKGEVVLGGTSVRGDAASLAETDADPIVAAGILERCRRRVPELRGARPVAHLVGLRPGRSSVRCDRATLPGASRFASTVVHCYGHGGAGVTLSWGTADTVRELVTNVGAR